MCHHSIRGNRSYEHFVQYGTDSMVFRLACPGTEGQCQQEQRHVVSHFGYVDLFTHGSGNYRQLNHLRRRFDDRPQCAFGSRLDLADRRNDHHFGK